MPEASRRRPTIFSFQDDPPEIAYLSRNSAARRRSLALSNQG